MVPQMKKFAKPPSARSQLKNCDPPSVASLAKARKPNAIWMMMDQIGRPCLSMYTRNLGAMPCAARACRVRVLPKVALFATDRTDKQMTTLKTEGRPLIPARTMA